MKTTEKIQRITERGQITLPISWRKKAGVRSILVREHGDGLEIVPFRTQDERDEEWVTLFDAVRDNKGKGVPADTLIASLEKTLKKKK